MFRAPAACQLRSLNHSEVGQVRCTRGLRQLRMLRPDSLIFPRQGFQVPRSNPLAVSQCHQETLVQKASSF